MTLTASQKEAVQKTDRNILVSAGAGTGKTHVLVERVLFLLKTQRAFIKEFLILTFTEKAANEIKTRLFRELHELKMEQSCRDLEKSFISTFHSFASHLLKEHPIEAGVDPNFRVIESEESELLREEALQETFRGAYEKRGEVFELLAVYGEESIRNGIFKIFTAARHEGKTLQEFFLETEKGREEICGKREKELPNQAAMLIQKLEAIDSSIWQNFYDDKDWNWKTMRDFREWSSHYAFQRKEEWKEWRELLKDLGALRMESLVKPFRVKLEEIALEFEGLYTTKKKEKGFLDFDDLQMKAVGLFSGEKPMLKKLREHYQKQFKYILIDEFQDTNFLQMRFAELLSSTDNLFMVGDYKQSIYGFRGAEPRIFLEKEVLYKNEIGGKRIFLSESFRSEPGVVDFINRFFMILWEKDDFPFEPLITGRKQITQEPVIELLATEVRDGEAKEHARMREAQAIAMRIQELHGQGNVPYGDIAILFQAMTVSGIYEDVFKKAGIPYFVVAGRGFYEQPEIQDMMSFLTHLEKPLADIPLAATLRSPFFYINDDTLFWLSRHAKAIDQEIPLYKALQELNQIKEISTEQQKRLHFFVELSAELGKLKDRIPLSELIDKILERTGYELSVLIGLQGVRHFANLKKLIAIVREYEAYERMTLATFLNILQRLQAQDVRESEAQIALETGADAVRIMSVHAAKGLEFDVVFVADMGHRANYGASKVVIAHAAEGYSMRIPNKLDLEMEEPYFYKVLDQNLHRREEEEWKRLFYVAVTRARARVFLSGVYEKPKKAKKLFSEMISWMEWAMHICTGLKIQITQNDGRLMTFPARKSFSEKETIEKIFGKISTQTPQTQNVYNQYSEFTGEPTLLRAIDLPVSAYVLFQKNPKEFWQVYQIGWAVSENGLASERMVFEEDMAAADFGTAMHTFFEHFDFKHSEKYLECDFLKKIFRNFEEESIIEARKLIEKFMQGGVFKQLQRAKRIEREIDFVLNERHGLIHGKLDVLFQDEKEKWHILDYKTATGDAAAAHQSAYDLQLEMYALAAQKILQIPVCSGMIYYLKNQKSVVFPFRKDGFENLEKKINDLQKKILDYANSRINFQENSLRP